MAIFKKSFEPKLVYVYRINDEAHEGILKVGEATYDGDDYLTVHPCSKELNAAAKDRINHQTQTAGIRYELLYTEITTYYKNKTFITFQDHEVHDCLVRSGIRKKVFDTERKANEWFYTDLETVKKAIAAVKEGRQALSAGEISKDRNPIVFRPEQRDAIDRTIKQFNKKNGSKQMLWNAKMRFGKTLTALQVIKECDIRRTLILTHRPVVDKGWFEDYEKIFYDRPEFVYGSKNNGASLSQCEKTYHETETGSYIYFVSIQDMRGSELVGGKFAKNETVFAIDWDLIIIDEAHEGTQTDLGKNVLSACRKPHTRVLHLSGTPFNLMDDFKEEEIYTWDYVMEQKAKADWEVTHQGDPNPYGCLPRLNIYTYNLGKLFPDYADADIAFNFREFFRVDEEGDFIHETNVRQFLDLLTNEDAESNYPYATQNFRDNFRHSLWMVPGVKEAKALSKLLQKHPVFEHFRVANVAGDGDEEVQTADALKLVEKAIGPHPEETYSVTLSCGRLTTGVSVKPWTACFMLAGSYNTAASSYMQTIFRVQTPATIAGKMKTECFVFDFAPDRTLKVIAETVKISAKAGGTSGSDRAVLGAFLNFCPIIGFEGSRMQPYNTEKMLGQLKKAYVERVVRNGFEDGYLYSDELLKLDTAALKDFDELSKIIKSTKAQPKTGDININSLGFTEEEFEQLSGKKDIKEKRTLTPEEEAQRKKLEEARKNRETAISILRGISIRMPLLIYGAELQKNLDGSEVDITIDNFTDIVDELSWKEFMPAGVTKEMFDKFKKYYDPDIFRESGVRIRQMTQAADSLRIEERIERISTIFNTFRNPDKETVLTPWRVVNMHLTESIGGWCFYDQSYGETVTEPRFVEQPDITKNIYKKNTHILEINAKSGLYALYCAYSIYKTREKLELGPKHTKDMERELWAKVLRENIFIICKTPMAKSITRRTLTGFTGIPINAHYFEDLITQLKHKPENFITKVKKAAYWKQEGNEDMKFNAVVGNPPYQEMDGGAGASSVPVYQYFIENAEKMNPDFISMIIPARWYAGGKGLDDFRSNMLNNTHVKKLYDFANSEDCFPTVNIAGGLCFFLWQRDYIGDCEVRNYGNSSVMIRSLNEYDVFVRNNFSVEIIRKIVHDSQLNLNLSVKSYSYFSVRSYERGAESRSADDDVVLVTSKGNGFYPLNKITDRENIIDKYKVIITYAMSGGNKPSSSGNYQIVSSLQVLEKNEVCTETYLVLGVFDKKSEAENMKKYIATRFSRFLMLQALTSIHITKDSFIFVPLQDFTANSDIDWTKSIINIDGQLYKKYNLSQEEIAFIESKIKAME
ncbi:MAG: Eco57I restriction-modification methylase domain-containing protein [Spirochaetia bacterium]|nr:Eco57I restriction-modification methylase domain-containing protein [Spirochaetia bacterium]